MTHNTKDYFVILLVFLFGLIIALAGSHNSVSYNAVPLLIVCLMVSFVFHWIAFIPSYMLRTEKYYDISGTVSYLLLLFTSSYLTVQFTDKTLHTRSIFIMFLVAIWALRLGIFLFLRVIRAGHDQRFKKVKEQFSPFLVWWSMSALWVFLTTANALTAIINNSDSYDDLYFYSGIFIWIVGFSFEVIADEQKRRFRSLQENKNHFISSGLWSISRHPNYFGEILLWIGMAVVAFPTLKGWQYFTLISPLFIYLLLTRISGVNLLEDIADKKWGQDEKYQKYKMNTPVLVPFL